jgi:hypothetical protein
VLTTATHSRIDKRGRVVTEKLQVKVPDSYPRQLVDWADLRQMSKVAIIRDGHLGDLVMLTGVLRCLRKQCLETTFDLYCDECYIPLFYASPHTVDDIGSLDKTKYDAVIDLRGFVENSPDALMVDRISLFGRAFGLSVWDGIPELCISPAGQAATKEILRTLGIKGNNFVVIAPDASDPCRCLTDEFVDGLQEELPIPSIVVGLWRGMRIDIPTLVALVHESCAVVCGDNGVYHIAGAFRTLVNSYPVMTTFPLELRCCWYQNCRPMVPAVPCAPCYENRQLPDGKDCLGVCMNALNPGAIASRIMQEAVV